MYLPGELLILKIIVKYWILVWGILEKIVGWLSSPLMKGMEVWNAKSYITFSAVGSNST